MCYSKSMVKDLYIIGNGFDMHHDIPSGYLNYRDWLERNKPSVLCEIDDFFTSVDDNWWSNFETNLTTVEMLQIAYQSAFENQPDFSSDDFKDADWYRAEHDVRIKLESAFSDITQSFKEWIKSLPQGNIAKKIRIRKEDSLFLTFNYSETLESLYSIPSNQILYIHGKANSDDQLILGHGSSYKELAHLFEKNESIESGEYVLQRAKDSAVYSVYKYRKPVEKIIENYNRWFEKLNDRTHIHIYGHSFSAIDLPYFRKVFSSVYRNLVSIEISDYKDKNHVAIESFMSSEGYNKDQYSIVTLNQLLER